MTCHSALADRVACPRRALALIGSSESIKHLEHPAPFQIGARSVCRPEFVSCSAKHRTRTSESTACSATAQPDQLQRKDREETTLRRQRQKMDEGLARSMLSDPDLEGEPLKLLRPMEAFWKVRQHNGLSSSCNVCLRLGFALHFEGQGPVLLASRLPSLQNGCSWYAFMAQPEFTSLCRQ